MRRKLVLALLILGLVLLHLSPSLALGDSYGKRGGTEWTVSYGIGENYKLPPHTWVPQFRYNSLSAEYGKFISRGTTVGCQLYTFERVTGEENSGFAILGKYRHYYLVKGRVSADYAIGFGGMRIHRKLRGQATTLNFAEQLSAGLRYATATNTAIRLEYRFCHASNAGIEKPNDGINAAMVTLGYTWYQ